jgi:hypothetical protein
MSPQPRRNGSVPQAPSPVIPFVAAAHEHTEPMFDVTVAAGAPPTAAANLGPFDVPAFGYLRHIFIEVDMSGGTLGAGVVAADFPWNFFTSITLSDVNGAPIFGPLDGYATLWANIIGGYAGGANDPRNAPSFDATINGIFCFRIPVEIARHNGMGSLANQNAAASYKLSLTTAASTVTFSTAPTTVPAFRIRGWLEAWTLPNEVDVAGRPQAQLPPAHGTTQYWSQFVKSTGVGANTTLLPRVGNLIRNILIIARTTAAGTPRDNTVFPDPPTLAWDARSLRNDSQNYITQRMRAALPDLTARDAGVFAYIFGDSDHGSIGDDDPTLWLPTVQSTRLELTGSSVAAGTLQVITNDVAPVEVVPAERFVETSASGSLQRPTVPTTT